jgi:putative peptidoglycan lipid II flippase
MFKNTVIVTFFIVLSSILGFFSQIIFVTYFGASVEMDIYFKLLSVPSVITGITPMIFSSVLIPHLAIIKTSKHSLDNFINSIWSFIIIVSILFVLIGFTFSIYNLDFFVSETNYHLTDIATQVSLLIWLGSGFSIMSSYLIAILSYHKEFFKIAWTSLLPALFMISFVLLFHHNLGIRSISLGFCTAFLCQFIIFLKACNISFNFRFMYLPNKILLLKQTFLVILSLLPYTLLVPISYFIVSKMEDGSVAYLGYAQNFAGFLSVAVGMGISLVSFPNLSDNFANKKGNSTLFKFEKSLRYIILIAVFLSAILIALRIPILSFFYQRGQFNANSVKTLSDIVMWYLVGAIFTSGLNLLRTLFYAKGDFFIIAMLGLIVPFFYIITAFIFSDLFSIVGIGIANSLTSAILFFTMIFIVKQKENNFLTNGFFIFFIKIIGSVVLAYTSAFLIMIYFSYVFSHIFLIIFFLLFFTAFYFIYSKFLFKIKEMGELNHILMIRLKPSRS